MRFDDDLYRVRRGSLRLSYNEGMIAATFGGIVAGPDLMTFLAEIDRTVCLLPVTAGVWCLDHCVVLLEPGDLRRLWCAAGPRSSYRLPTSIVSTEVTAGQWLADAWELAQQGVIRRVFTSRLPAFQWGIRSSEPSHWGKPRVPSTPQECAGDIAAAMVYSP